MNNQRAGAIKPKKKSSGTIPPYGPTTRSRSRISRANSAQPHTGDTNLGDVPDPTPPLAQPSVATPRQPDQSVDEQLRLGNENNKNGEADGSNLDHLLAASSSLDKNIATPRTGYPVDGQPRSGDKYDGIEQTCRNHTEPVAHRVTELEAAVPRTAGTLNIILARLTRMEAAIQQQEPSPTEHIRQLRRDVNDLLETRSERTRSVEQTNPESPKTNSHPHAPVDLGQAVQVDNNNNESERRIQELTEEISQLRQSMATKPTASRSKQTRSGRSNNSRRSRKNSVYKLRSGVRRHGSGASSTSDSDSEDNANQGDISDD